MPSDSSLSFKLLTLRYYLRSRFKIGKKKRREEARQAFTRFLAEVTPDSIAIDCGANQGDVIQRFLDAGMQVHAFEPDPVALEIIDGKLADHPKLTLHRVAVGAAPSTATLYRRKQFDDDPGYWTMSSSLLQRKVCDDANTVEVEVIDFIQYLRNFSEPIAVLKIDIEGSEVALLAKLLETDLYQDIPLIFVETHERISFDCAIRTARIRAKIHQQGLSQFNLDHA